jgi:hypothetical protein
MKKSINTYTGLMQDTAYDSIKSALYIDARDVRITTSEGESQGAITNMIGNEQAFIVPQNDSGTQLGLKEIIGVATIREKIIIFTTDDSGNNGWIYYVEYDLQTRNINALTPRLIYDNNGSPEELFFKKDWPIEAVGRFESECTQRIYWTDYNNFIRSLNIADFNTTSSPITTHIGVIDIFPDITYTQPILLNIAPGGGSLKAGMYQFAYRLRTDDGKTTLISPPGNIMHIIGSSENASPSGKMMGSRKGTITGKTITIRIDTTNYINIFEYIELIGIFYEDYNGTPEIFTIETNNLDPGSTFIDIIYSGNEESITTILPIEYAVKIYPFKTAKTIVPKDNSLVIANIKQSFFSIQDLLAANEEFNAQTYRYDSGASLPGPAADDATKFNVKYNADRQWMGIWHTDEQYKYKLNGTTLGGQSLATTAPIGTGAINISYQFTLKKRLLDTGQQPGDKINWLGPDTTDSSYNDGYTYYNKSYGNDGSAYITGLSRGYKRGETYRFGIVFYNKKGEASYVEHLGDIKFPDISDKDDVLREGQYYFPVATDVTPPTLGDSHETWGYDVGLDFTLDFSSCPSILTQVSAWQIVRVPRSNEDKRRICSGIGRTTKNISVGPEESQTIWNFEAPNNENISHPYFYSHFYGFTGATGHQLIGSVMNGQWTTFSSDQMKLGIQNAGSSFYQSDDPDYINKDYILLYSPEISYNWQVKKSIPTGVGEDLGLLMTGSYGLFAGYPENIEGNWSARPSNWYSRETVHTLAPKELFGKNGNIVDVDRKLRSTAPIDRETELGKFVTTPGVGEWPIAARGVEYFRGVRDCFFMSNGLAHEKYAMGQVGAQAVCMKTYATTESNGNTPRYLRNLYAGVNQAGSPTANAQGRRLNYPDNEINTALARGARCLAIATKAIFQDFQGNWTNPQMDSFHFRTYGQGVPAVGPEYWPNVKKNNGVSPLYPYCFPLPVTPGIYNEFNGIKLCPRSPYIPGQHQSSIIATPVFDLYAYKSEIYGGTSQSALENNIFIPCSAVIEPTNITDVKIYGGDTFIGMFELVINSTVLDGTPFAYGKGSPNSNEAFHENRLETIIFPVETGMQLELVWGDTPQKGAQQFWGSDTLFILRQENGNLSQGAGSSTYAPQVNNNGVSSGNAYTGVSGDNIETLAGPLYNPVYNLDNSKSSLAFFVKPATLGDCGIDDTRAYLSDVKINEESIDSWTIFRTENVYNVESLHGPINKILNWNDTVYFFQDRAVGSYSINPRAVTTTEDGQPTQLGSGKGFAHHKYFSTEFGSIHQWAVKATDKGIYYYDSIHKKIFKIGAEGNQPLSEIKGMHSFLEPIDGPILLRKLDTPIGGDNPILNRGVIVERDKINDEVFFTFRGFKQYRPFGYLGNGGAVTYLPDERVFIPNTEPTPDEGEYYQVGNTLVRTDDDGGFEGNRTKLITGSTRIDNEFTLVYDELAEQFSSFYSTTPPIYIENGDILISTNPTDRKTTFTHNKGNWGEMYGAVKEAYVKLVINPNADINKVLRFIEFNSIVNDNKNIAVDRVLTITAFRLQTEYQDTTKTAFSAATIKRRFDKWRVKIPRDQLSADKRGRLRSTYFILTLYYDNTYNKELILNRIMSHYDIQVF